MLHICNCNLQYVGAHIPAQLYNGGFIISYGNKNYIKNSRAKLKAKT